MKLALIATDPVSAARVATIARRAESVDLIATIAMGWSAPLHEKLSWITWERLLEIATETDLSCIIASDASELNQKRLARFMDCKKAGLRIGSLIGAGTVLPAELRLRANTVIGEHVSVLPGADFGANVFIDSGCTIGTGVRLGQSAWLGRHCRLGDGVHIGRNCVLKDGVDVASGVVIEPWSLFSEGIRVQDSPALTVFLDPLFRGRVELRGNLREPG